MKTFFSQASVAEVSQTRRWPVVEAIKAILLVCRGVAEIHRLGGVHGMISTSVFVGTSTEIPSQKGPRLLQYPLSGDPLGVFAADPLRSSQVAARFAEKICFVPPERLISGKPGTPTGDVYGMGCPSFAPSGATSNLERSPSATCAFIREEGEKVHHFGRQSKDVLQKFKNCSIT